MRPCFFKFFRAGIKANTFVCSAGHSDLAAGRCRGQVSPDLKRGGWPASGGIDWRLRASGSFRDALSGASCRDSPIWFPVGGCGEIWLVMDA